MRVATHHLAIPIALLAAATVLLAPLHAQRKERVPKWKIDPYTKNDPKLMAKLGYVSYGPFPFGMRGSNHVTSDEISKHLGYVNLLWVETAHFRIGLVYLRFEFVVLFLVSPVGCVVDVCDLASPHDPRRLAVGFQPRIHPVTPWLRVFNCAFFMHALG